ncbi:serine protease HTRA3-like [Diabrotica virgifera virgifera]|uniref:Serine protease HTRA3-like n=1 Tax=Diabrotica virgifera virgifera TaxID=50390 RepID=A0ABM5ILJ0_DIAVI|nr:serine protease HTRA3-like [Diabrotica virgifera virgifera]
MTPYRPLFYILFFVIYLSLVATAKEGCGPHYCDTLKPQCAVPKCTANQILVLKNPQLCRCCPQCYTIKGEGEPCREESYTVCGSNLKCIRKVCVKT